MGIRDIVHVLTIWSHRKMEKSRLKRLSNEELKRLAEIRKYRYVSVIQMQEHDGTPIDKKGVVLGRFVTQGCNIRPHEPGILKVFHVITLPYPMNKKEVWDYLDTDGK